MSWHSAHGICADCEVLKCSCRASAHRWNVVPHGCQLQSKISAAVMCHRRRGRVRVCERRSACSRIAGEMPG
jgi:hypothetical protein